MENKEVPLLSVCMITYNHALYIRQAIEGVLMQQVNFQWEFIIADDFSTDGTRAIVMEYAEKYPKFIKPLLQEKNVGAAKNWFDLLDAPIGKYIAYFEGDDYWTDPCKLQKQVDFLEVNEKFSACFHDAWILNEILNTKESFSILEKELLETEDLIKFGWTIPTHSLVFRKKSFPLPDWFNYIKNGDYSLQLVLSLSGPLYKFNEKMGVYRLHPNGLHNSFLKNRVFLTNQILKILYFFNYYSNFKYDNLITKKVHHDLESMIELPVEPYKNTRDNRSLAAKCFSKSFWKRKINEWL